MLELIDETIIKVRFSEVDSVGFVWHGNYVKYLEDGRESWGEKFGFSYMDMYKNNFVSPIVKIDIDYKSPLKHDDTAKIITKYIYSKAAKLEFSYTIINEKTHKIVAQATSTQVFIDLSENLFLTDPEFVENWKKKYYL